MIYCQKNEGNFFCLEDIKKKYKLSEDLESKKKKAVIQTNENILSNNIGTDNDSYNNYKNNNLTPNKDENTQFNGPEPNKKIKNFKNKQTEKLNIKISEQSLDNSSDINYCSINSKNNINYNILNLSNNLASAERHSLNNTTSKEYINNHFNININNNTNVIVINTNKTLEKFSSINSQKSSNSGIVKSILKNKLSSGKIDVPPLNLTKAIKRVSIENEILPICLKTKARSILAGDNLAFNVCRYFLYLIILYFP